MIELLTAAVWSPYLAGAGVGVMAVLSFLLAARPLGARRHSRRPAG